MTIFNVTAAFLWFPPVFVKEEEILMHTKHIAWNMYNGRKRTADYEDAPKDHFQMFRQWHLVTEIMLLDLTSLFRIIFQQTRDNKGNFVWPGITT